MSHLFSPLKLGNFTLPNRITVAPMCQYSAIDGSMTDWHIMHLGQYACSNIGLIIAEATGVEPRGRISPWCVGLYNDETQAAMARVVKHCKSLSSTKFGVQLAKTFRVKKIGVRKAKAGKPGKVIHRQWGQGCYDFGVNAVAARSPSSNPK